MNNQKQIVKDDYTQIVLQDKGMNAASRCVAANCSNEIHNVITDDYSILKGYKSDANLELGCGLPTSLAKIKLGDIVMDLGSGAGNDCFVARYETGVNGKVIGIDFTEAMIAKARKNAEKPGFHNGEFLKGDIFENMPLSSNSADVDMSNSVFNLVPNKIAVMHKIFRGLKPGGHFGISDIVPDGDLPEALRKKAKMYAGCVSGAIQKIEFFSIIQEADFKSLTLQKVKTTIIPDDILSKYLNLEEIEEFKLNSTRIYSVTLSAEKPIQMREKKRKTPENSVLDYELNPGCY